MRHKTHQRCMRSTLKWAEVLCRQKGMRLTPGRQRVLELICAQREPIKAYDILRRLQQEGYAPHPPTVYRALEFLLTHKLIHRLNSCNAYVGCTHPRDSHGECYFLVCSSCGEYHECCNDRLANAIRRTAKDNRFRATHTTLEIHGLCRVCAATAKASRAAL